MSVLDEMITDEEKNRIEPGTLYLLATPIGNLSDLSARAYKVLSGVDLIAAEDTRNTQKLLSCYGIRAKELISYFEHNKRERGPQILARLLSGVSCALVTDAGTPAISDPGEDLVRLCAENDVPVTAIPGCCAAVNALSLSALPTGRFVFEGFLSPSGSERKRRLSALTKEERTVILYEAPHKLRTTLSDLLSQLGNRRITLCREMTKKNEEIMRTTLEEAVAHYESHEPRGEYVLVIAGTDGTAAVPDEANVVSLLSPEERVAAHEKAGLSRMEAIKAAARELGVSKSVLYKQLQADQKRPQ